MFHADLERQLIRRDSPVYVVVKFPYEGANFCGRRLSSQDDYQFFSGTPNGGLSRGAGLFERLSLGYAIEKLFEALPDLYQKRPSTHVTMARLVHPERAGNAVVLLVTKKYEDRCSRPCCATIGLELSTSSADQLVALLQREPQRFSGIVASLSNEPEWMTFWPTDIACATKIDVPELRKPEQQRVGTVKTSASTAQQGLLDRIFRWPRK